jgi:hypothetical protein
MRASRSVAYELIPNPRNCQDIPSRATSTAASRRLTRVAPLAVVLARFNHITQDVFRIWSDRRYVQLR